MPIHDHDVGHDRFKDWRRIATRFDRNVKTFMGAISIAAAKISTAIIAPPPGPA
jgi:transposase